MEDLETLIPSEKKYKVGTDEIIITALPMKQLLGIVNNFTKLIDKVTKTKTIDLTKLINNELNDIIGILASALQVKRGGIEYNTFVTKEWLMDNAALPDLISLLKMVIEINGINELIKNIQALNLPEA